MVLKELIFNSFYFGTVQVVLKELIFNKSDTLGQCSGPERTDFEQFLLLGQCGGLKRTHF